MADEAAQQQSEEVAGSDELASLRTNLEGLKSQLEESLTAKKELEGKLSKSDEFFTSDDHLDYLDWKRAKVAEKPSEGEEVDFDVMTNAQIAKHLKGETKTVIDALRKQYEEEQKASREQLMGAFGMIDLKLTALEHPDLGEGLKDKAYKDEFYAVAQANPSWTSEQVYQQLSMQRKVAAQEKREVDRKRADEQLQVMAGKGGAPPSTVAERAMNAKDAAEAAYAVAFGTHGPPEE